MRQLALAVHNYASTNEDRLPPAYSRMTMDNGAGLREPGARESVPGLARPGMIGRLREIETIAEIVRRASVESEPYMVTIIGNAGVTRQTLNLDEFGIPIATGVTDPFDIYRLQLRASQTVFDASLIGRLRAARDTAVAAGLDAQAAGEIAGATAGLAYLRTLSAIATAKAISFATGI